MQREEGGRRETLRGGADVTSSRWAKPGANMISEENYLGIKDGIGAEGGGANIRHFIWKLETLQIQEASK